jgi:hypothetical protein
VRALKARTASMSVTHSVSPTSAMPLGAFRPVMNALSITIPAGPTRLMKPFPSFAVGAPLMFETK